MDETKLPALVDSGDRLRAAGLVHRVVEPPSEGPHPTIVMLHGRYGDENAMWLFQKVLPANWLKVAPRGIVEDPPHHYSWVPREDGYWPQLSQFDEAVSKIEELLSSLEHTYNADMQRLYLMGFSQGAATAYAVAMRHPGRLRAIASLVGFVPEGCEDLACLNALRHMPVFVAAGMKDPLIPLERSRKSADVLRKGGARLTYREYETGHKLNRQGMKDLQQFWREMDEAA